MIRSIVTGVLFIGGAFCLWLVTLTPYAYPLRILVFFGAGIVLGIVSGVFFGRVLRDRLVQRRRTTPAFSLLALLNLTVFAFFSKPLPTENVDTSTLMSGILLPLLAATLLTLNAYLLGFLLVPGKKAPPRTRGLRWMVLLYVSLLAGIIVGLNTGIWQRGVVPLEPLKSTASDDHEMTWREALETTKDTFPPSVTTEEREDGSIWIEGHGVDEPDYLAIERVIDATGPVVAAGDTRIKCLGYAMLPPALNPNPGIYHGDDDEAFHVYAQELISHATFWSLDGQPMEPVSLPDYVIMPWGISSSWDHLCIFVFSMPEEVWGTCEDVRLVQLPWGDEKVASGSFTGEAAFYLLSSVEFPVSSEAEFRFRTFLGGRNEYTMPTVEGSSLTTGTNLVLFVGLYPRRYERINPTGLSQTIVIEFPEREEIAEDPTPGATSVLWCSLKDLAPGIEVVAVLDSGASVLGETRFSRSFVVTRFDADMKEIRKLKILEAPGSVEIRYPVHRLQGLPPENENVMNRLDMWYESVKIPNVLHGSGVFMFRQEVLGDRCSVETFSSYVWAPREPHRNVTVRDILNYYFPGRWWVRDGVVYTTCDRFGPVAWKVRESMREVTGKGRRSRMRE